MDKFTIISHETKRAVSEKQLTFMGIIVASYDDLTQHFGPARIDLQTQHYSWQISFEKYSDVLIVFPKNYICPANACFRWELYAKHENAFDVVLQILNPHKLKALKI